MQATPGPTEGNKGKYGEKIVTTFQSVLMLVMMV
jgi:hypothetical protein